jgi:hypothetical protein
MHDVKKKKKKRISYWLMMDKLIYIVEYDVDDILR